MQSHITAAASTKHSRTRVKLYNVNSYPAVPVNKLHPISFRWLFLAFSTAIMRSLSFSKNYGHQVIFHYLVLKITRKLSTTETGNKLVKLAKQVPPNGIILKTFLSKISIISNNAFNNAHNIPPPSNSSQRGIKSLQVRIVGAWPAQKRLAQITRIDFSSQQIGFMQIGFFKINVVKFGAMQFGTIKTGSL